MADCLSSSIFSLWPKRNSSSKCTNYKILSLYTPLKFYRLPQRQIHTQARSHTRPFARTRTQRWRARVCNVLGIDFNVLGCCTHKHARTQYKYGIRRLSEKQSNTSAHLVHSFSHWAHRTHTHTNWTANCVSDVQCQFRLYVNVNRSALVLAFTASYMCLSICSSLNGKATGQSRRENESKNSSHTRRVTWWNSNECQPTIWFYSLFRIKWK